MTVYGYARVSTDGQTLAAQDAALAAAGCAKIYSEKISGARSDRPQLAKMLKVLGAEDTVVVTRLGRLARSTRDLLNILDVIAKTDATFRSLADTWADTTTPHGADADGPRRSGGVRARVDQSPHWRRPRARQGPWRAYGRPRKLTVHQRQEALERRERGDSLTDIDRTYGVSHTTIGRL